MLPAAPRPSLCLKMHTAHPRATSGLLAPLGAAVPLTPLLGLPWTLLLLLLLLFAVSRQYELGHSWAPDSSRKLTGHFEPLTAPSSMPLTVAPLSDGTSCALSSQGLRPQQVLPAPGPQPTGRGQTRPGVHGSCGRARVYEKRSLTKAATDTAYPADSPGDVGLPTWPRRRLSEMPTEGVPPPLPATPISPEGSPHEQPTRKQWGACPASLRAEHLHPLSGMLCGGSDSSRSCVYIRVDSWISILCFGWEHNAVSLTRLLKLQPWQQRALSSAPVSL